MQALLVPTRITEVTDPSQLFMRVCWKYMVNMKWWVAYKDADHPLFHGIGSSYGRSKA